MTAVDLCQVAADLGRITVELRQGGCSLGLAVPISEVERLVQAARPG